MHSYMCVYTYLCVRDANIVYNDRKANKVNILQLNNPCAPIEPCNLPSHKSVVLHQILTNLLKQIFKVHAPGRERVMTRAPKASTWSLSVL